MRILLVAYEFPPSASPQALRWTYLCGRLAGLGHEVHVLAPAIRARLAGLPEMPGTVRVHRLPPGPFWRSLDWVSSRSRRMPATGEGTSAEDVVRTVPGPVGLNWKGRLLERFQRLVSYFIYPDIRGEWRWVARKALPPLLDELRPEVVVSSHEPAVTLELGLDAAKRGYAWVADLGDPVLAGYTPARWRRRARALERAVIDRAAHVLVTTERTKHLLVDRHDACASKISVVPQGFDETRVRREPQPGQGHGPIVELLFAGSFYAFRRPDALVGAVLGTPGVRLNIASSNAPEVIRQAAESRPDRIRLLGYLPHTELIRLQADMDVLVNIANDDPCQVPGKFYEYLGAGRPILHLSARSRDAAAELVSGLRRGWVCSNDEDAIVATLGRIAQAGREGHLLRDLDLGMQAVGGYSWGASAVRLEGILRRIVEADA